jgi:hypothetical protein
MDHKEAKVMSWHAKRTKMPDDDDEAEKDDKMLTHPSDATQLSWYFTDSSHMGWLIERARWSTVTGLTRDGQ